MGATIEDKLADTEKALADLKAEYEEYCYVVSHDFSAPMRQIEGFARLILDRNADGFDEKTRKHMEFVLLGAERGKGLLSALLEYSRLNTQAEDFDTVDLMQALEVAQNRLARQITMSGAEIEVSTLPKVTGDASQLAQVFYHLLDNALKFQPEGQKPVISIAAETSGDEVVVTIADNGIGIEEKQLERVLIPLRRAVGDDEYPGLGIGLAIVRKIIRRHGGELRITSEYGKSTQVQFTLKLGQKE